MYSPEVGHIIAEQEQKVSIIHEILIFDAEAKR